MVNIIVDYLAPVSRDYRGALGRGAGSSAQVFTDFSPGKYQARRGWDRKVRVWHCLFGDILELRSWPDHRHSPTME